MPVTLQEAIQIANSVKYAPILIGIIEYSDRYVFDYTTEKNENLIVSRLISVMKETGKIEYFFPPDYDDDYLNSGVEISVPDDI